MATKFTKKETFFKFEKEVYNPETEKFTIPNLESEGKRLDNWVGDETLKITQEEECWIMFPRSFISRIGYLWNYARRF